VLTNQPTGFSSQAAIMGMHGYLHRVPADRLDELLAHPERIEAELMPVDDEGEPCLSKTTETVEKAWNAIEFILDRLAQAGKIPWIGPLAEGESTGIEFDYGDCWYRTPDEVRDLAATFEGITKEEFRTGYTPEAMAKHGVYPSIWDRVDEREENFEYVWQWYGIMVDHYRQAAAHGEGMLLYLG